VALRLRRGGVFIGVLAQHDAEAPLAEQPRGHDDRWIPAAPVVTATGKEPHRIAVAPDLQPVAVVFDRVNPAVTRRRLGSAGRDA
jgi:hypothetical protein